VVEEGAAQQAGAAATVGVEAVGVEAAAKAQEAGAAGAAQEAGAAGANPRRAEPAARPEGLRQERALCPKRKHKRHRGGSLQASMRWPAAKQLKQPLPALTLSASSKELPELDGSFPPARP
jgi:hypothetical protein